MPTARASLCLALAALVAGCGAGYTIRHTVTPGENVSVLAARAGLSESEFRKMNRMGAADIVRPGDTVYLPGDTRPAPKEEPERAAPSPSAPRPSPRPEPAPPSVVPSRPVETDLPARPERSARPPPKSTETPRTEPSPPPSAQKIRPPKPPRPAVAQERKSGLNWPVDGDVVRGFGKSGAVENLGIDIGAPTGTKVRAAAGGKVIYAGTPTPAYGPLIVIDHGGKLHTVYSSLRDLAVKRGDFVDTGHILGTIGDRVTTASSHVHFEVRKGGDAVDPLLFLPAR